MKLLEEYHLFLFDFDGLLVNTEALHFEAYRQMCANRGITLEWDFATYASYAHYSAEGFRNALYEQYPDLARFEPCWDILYAEKKRLYVALIQEGAIELMPGAHALLEALAQAGKKRCVVTHSPLEQIELIRAQHPILQTIPHWITRADYSSPKPDPECYQKAIALHKKPHERAIGFEDSPRGLKALLGTEAQGVLVTDFHDTEAVKEAVGSSDFIALSSLSAI